MADSVVGSKRLRTEDAAEQHQKPAGSEEVLDGGKVAAVVEVLDDADFITTVKQEPWGISQELLDMLRKGDVLLLCQGGRAVRCHRAILELASPVLCDMLESTSEAHGCSKAKPVKLPVPEDDAQHWLYMLMYLYPLASPSPPTATPATAMALVSVGDKYDLSKTAVVWEQFAASCSDAKPDVGQYTWPIINWRARARRTAPLESPQFTAAGHTWCLRLYPQGHDDPDNQHLSVFLASRGAGDKPHVRFKFGIASPTRFFSDTWSEIDDQEFTDDANGYTKFMPLSEVDQYVTDDTLHVCVSIAAMPGPSPSTNTGATGQWHLSPDPSHPGYVCTWLRVAVQMGHDAFKTKCMTYLALSGLHVQATDEAWEDARAAMQCLDADDMLQLVFLGRDT